MSLIDTARKVIIQDLELKQRVAAATAEILDLTTALSQVRSDLATALANDRADKAEIAVADAAAKLAAAATIEARSAAEIASTELAAALAKEAAAEAATATIVSGGIGSTLRSALTAFVQTPQVANYLQGLEIDLILNTDTAYYPVDLMPFRRQLQQAQPVASPDIGLFNTGVNAAGLVLPDGALNPPGWSLASVPSGAPTDLIVRRASGGYPIPPYLGDNEISAWIGPWELGDTTLTAPPGTYKFRATFNLTGRDHLATSILLQLAADDSVTDILINGTSTGAGGIGFASFGVPSISIASGFVPGINTLDFIVQNGGSGTNPCGLRVELSITAPLPSNLPPAVLNRLNLAPAFAFSVNRITSIPGSVFRIDRDSDRATLELGYAGDQLDLAALNAFIGTSGASVAIIYDKSGNNRHAVQTDKAKQPRIAENGVVNMANGKPTLRFTNSSIVAPAPMTTLAELDLFAMYMEVNRVKSTSFDLTGNDYIRGAAHLTWWEDGSVYFDIGDFRNNPADRIYTTYPISIRQLAAVEFTHSTAANSKQVISNGETIVSGIASVDVPACTQLEIGHGGQGYADCTFSEIIIFDRVLTPSERADLTADRISAYPPAQS